MTGNPPPIVKRITACQEPGGRQSGCRTHSPNYCIIRMRIVFVLGSSNIGGTELNTLRSATALVRRGHDVTQILIGSPGTLVDRFAQSGVRLERVQSRSLAHPDILRTSRHISSIIREHDAQVVHTHDVFANIIGVPSARIARTPVVISSRRWWKATPRRVHRVLNRLSYAMSTATVANAPSVANMLVGDERVPSERVHYIPNLIDESLLVPRVDENRKSIRSRLGVPDEAVVIMCVARLVPVKNHALLLRAFAAVARESLPLQLVLIGDGPLRQSLESQAAALGVQDRVTFAGELHGAACYYQGADIAILTSASEGMPNTLLEAMACGLPVISTAVGGCVDIVKTGTTGILVRPNAQAELEAAIVELASSAESRLTLGSAGLQAVMSQHTESSVMNQLESLYDGLLSRVASRRVAAHAAGTSHSS